VTSVAIIGLGLIGGSLLRRLAADRAVLGYDADPATRQAARDAGHAMTDDLPTAVAGADVVVLATPLPALPGLLPAVAAAIRPGALLTDVVSVKEPVRDMARALAPAVRFVGGHPMAGTERSGFAASDPNLFAGAPWVLCLERDTDLAGWLQLATLVTGLGCRVVPATAAEHDRAVARISHLPHLLAAALAIAGGQGGELALKLAAGSFRDGTRVAGTRPELTAAMCEANRVALADAVDATVARLTEARDALRAGGSVAGLLDAGFAARRRWVAAGMGGTEVMLGASGPTLAADLLELGRAGGHLVEVSDGKLHGWRPAG
jgi:prephenate dehydrogenase